MHCKKAQAGLQAHPAGGEGELLQKTPTTMTDLILDSQTAASLGVERLVCETSRGQEAAMRLYPRTGWTEVRGNRGSCTFHQCLC